MIRVFFTIFFLFLSSFPAWAAEPCAGSDRACLIQELEETAAGIQDDKWRDIAYRELAKSLTSDGRTEEAIALIDKIESPDTRAMTIRGIGMEAAGLNLSADGYSALFKSLSEKASAISHPPSHEIALTYISMAQAFAKQDQEALKTAASMSNDALKHKAFGEIAEIQAERKDAAAALATLQHIDSESYRNKSTRTISLLLADRGLFDDASRAAHAITNPTLKAEALQYILVQQKKPE
jgi:hypothetical protein